MSDYISRELLLNNLNDIRKTYKEAKKFNAVSAIDNAIGEVKNTPSADVRPERHGRWVIVEYEYLTCSCCGDYYYTGMDSTEQAMANLIDGKIPKYCPNCGTKMDGKDGE